MSISNIFPFPLRPFLIAAFLTILLAGCFPDHLQSTFDPKGPVAAKQLTLFYWIFWPMVLVLVAVLGVLLYIIVRFRRRPGDTDIPKQVHGHRILEIVWTIPPVIILAIAAVPATTTLFELDRAPAGALEVNVIGHQWWWEFEYPEYGIVTANEMHIPVGRAVSMTLTSADVIHSFWVPKLGGKQDVVPTRENPLWFQADEPSPPEGYYGQCAELCGVSHANMRLRVFAEHAPEFNLWVQQQQATPRSGDELEGLAAEGADLFANQSFAGGQQCVFCHTVAGLQIQGKVGPDLSHVGGRVTIASAYLDNTPENLKAWLQDPSGVKPGALMPKLDLASDQVDALVAYLGSLK